MNVLQSFMGCMYPGSIKTDSIESLDHDPSCRYQVTNIDEKAEEVSRGEIQLTERDLIYFRPGKFPIRWSIECIRRYGCTEGGEIFTFETGRKSPTGEGIYAFHLNNGQDLVNQLKERLEKCSNTTATDDATTCLKRRLSLKQTKTCFGSASHQAFKDNNYTIDSLDLTHARNQNIQVNPSKRDNNEIRLTSLSTTARQIPITSTYTDFEISPLDSSRNIEAKSKVDSNELKKLPYSKINPIVTQSLNELAQAHAANRQAKPNQ